MKSILLVDGNKKSLITLSEFLGWSNNEVLAVGSIREALDLLRDHTPSPDVIVADVNMTPCVFNTSLLMNIPLIVMSEVSHPNDGISTDMWMDHLLTLVSLSE